MKKILILNGPNLNMLGQRDSAHYGTQTLKQINNTLQSRAKKLDLNVEFFQSNIEGELVNKIQSFKGNAIIINAGAYTHYSIAIADALKDCDKIKIEVHLSNILAREEFRHKSVIAPHCFGVISGFGAYSYMLALDYLGDILHHE